ncbi:NAD(P)H-dependent oxidoreductase [Paenibacillus caui]|uniref:NAD(P)H-dependent oxidoreductase n=1 Tax=Paenibacillus caui TaxID=2873927 RepID=UPI001CA96576|nr:NAD(P)H-dependent oxidoreductase [Paenibacillus caui]
MKILVLIAHPNLSNSKMNSLWKQELENIPNVTVHDLYQHYSHQPIDLPLEQKLLLTHDRIVFQFPFYWYSTPPLLKRWIDEVFAYGWAYGPGGKALQGKELVLAISVGGPEHSYRAGGYNHFTISELTRPLQATANTTGMDFLPHYIQYSTGDIDDKAAFESAKNYVIHITNEDLNHRNRLAKQLARMEEQGIVLKTEE